MKNQDHWDEIDRLWKAISRDFFVSLMLLAGLGDIKDETRLHRLLRNWDALCEKDIDIAASIAHGCELMSDGFSKLQDPSGPAARNEQRFNELFGVISIGRKANPDAEVKTVGELYKLGEAAIRSELDEDLEPKD